jgi:hypothetical protein
MHDTIRRRDLDGGCTCRFLDTGPNRSPGSILGNISQGQRFVPPYSTAAEEESFKAAGNEFKTRDNGAYVVWDKGKGKEAQGQRRDAAQAFVALDK